MGNTHSSMGLTFGSVLGGLIAAPFTGGASIAYVAIACGAGTAIGATAFTINALNNRDAPGGKEISSFLTGLGCGTIGPLCGMAVGMGVEVSIGVEAAGVGLGLGATNSGDGKPKPYVGNQQKAVKYYTQQEEKKNYEKEVKKEVKKEEVKLLNNYMSQYNREYINYFNNVSHFYTKKTIKKTFKFVSHQINDTKAFDKIQFRVYNDNPQVERVYVIRRKLDTLPFYFGWMAHSGLLLKTTNGRWFICEYGTENDKNKVSLYEVPNTIKEPTCDTFQYQGRKWNKQICGSSIKASIQSVKETMENKVCKHSYWMLFWNCHMAQEGVREELGLKVDKKYMDKQFEEEYRFSFREWSQNYQRIRYRYIRHNLFSGNK